MNDYRPVEEPFGTDEPNFTDTTEPDSYPDDMLQDKPPSEWEEANTDDPTADEAESEEDVADLGEGEEPFSSSS